MSAQDIKTVCAIGTGAMGAATVVRFAMAGYNVNFCGRTPNSIEGGMKSLHAAMDTMVRLGQLDEAEKPNILARIKTFHGPEDTKTYPLDVLAAAAGEADYVIESISENLGDKRVLYAGLHQVCPPHTIFTSNSSALDPTDIFADMPDERGALCAGGHEWNPPHLLRLVEVVPSERTSTETIDTIMDVIESIGKKPVRMTRAINGFIGNRLQIALLREALAILAEGEYSAEVIDTEVKATFGKEHARTGPLAAACADDFITVQQLEDHAHSLSREGGIPALLQQMVDAGTLGAKTGQGIYEWQPERLAALRAEREKNIVGLLKMDLADEAGVDCEEPIDLMGREPSFIGKRLRLAVLREALYIHALGVASAADIDLVYVETIGRRLGTTGPLESADIGGLDIFRNIFDSTGDSLCRITDAKELIAAFEKLLGEDTREALLPPVRLGEANEPVTPANEGLR